MGYRRRYALRDWGGAGLTAAWRRVIGAGFALPRDAGDRRSRVPGGSRAVRVVQGHGRRSRPGIRGWCGTYGGMAQGHRCWFRAPARCRSETGAPGCPRSCRARGEGWWGTVVGRALRDSRVVRDLRRRGAASSALVSRSRAMKTGAPGELPGAPVARGEGWWGTVVGRALRDSRVVRDLRWRGAGSSVLVSRSRAMPV